MSPPPRLPAGERLRRAGIAAWSLIGLAILLVAFVWLLFRVKVIFPPLVLALLIIYFVNPLVSRFERRGIRRSIAVVLSYLLVLGSGALLVMGATPFVSAQMDELSTRMPELRAELVGFARDVGDGVEERFGVRVNTEQFECLVGEEHDPENPSPARCDQLTRRFRQSLASQAGRITEIGLGLLEALLVFILAPLIALYLLIDLPQIQRDLLNLVPEANRAEVSDLAGKLGRAVGGFFRGQLLVALLVGLMSALGFWLIGLPFWFLIGAIAGFFNLVPLVGPFIGGGIGFVIGVMHEGTGLGLLAILVELIVQQVDNHLISPYVMSRTVKLHPATIMLALLAGATVAGFWGVLLGVPAVAAIKLLVGHLWVTRVLGVETSPYSRVAAVRPAGAIGKRFGAVVSPPPPAATTGEAGPAGTGGPARRDEDPDPDAPPPDRRDGAR